MLETEKPFFTFPETAKEAHVSLQTVRRWHRVGLLKAYRPVLGANLRVARDEVERLKQGIAMGPANA